MERGTGARDPFIPYSRWSESPAAGRTGPYFPLPNCPMTGRVREIMKELSPGLFEQFTADQVSHKFTDCAKKVGLKLHSFRHTFGTLLLAMGYDITVAKELLGHEDLNSTLRYSKADSRLLRDAMRNFDAMGKNGYRDPSSWELASGGKYSSCK